MLGITSVAAAELLVRVLGHAPPVGRAGQAGGNRAGDMRQVPPGAVDRQLSEQIVERQTEMAKRRLPTVTAEAHDNCLDPASDRSERCDQQRLAA